jgi:hypothetical protein
MIGELRRLTVKQAREMRDHLALAIERGDGADDWTVDDILASLKGDRLIPWGLYLADECHGIGITRLVVRPKRRLLDVMALSLSPGLSFRIWFPALLMLARDLQVDAIIGAGRKGWARAMGAKQLYSWELPLPSRTLSPALQSALDSQSSNERYETESSLASLSRRSLTEAPSRVTPSASTTSGTGSTSDRSGYRLEPALSGVGTSRPECA